MFYQAKLEMRSYESTQLEDDMLFFDRDQHLVWKFTGIRDVSDEEFFEINGYPVNPYIVDLATNDVLGLPEQIGWIDDDPEFIREITIDDMNYILNEHHGKVLIDIEEDVGDEVIPYIEDEKVFLKFLG